MSSLTSQSPLKHPQTHSPSFPPLPSHGYCISGKEIEICGSGSPQFFPVIRAWLAGLPWFPAPSVLRGTFSWPASKSPFTPFLPTTSLLHSSKLLIESSASLLHLAFQLPKLCGRGSPKAAWFHPSPKPHGSGPHG